MFQLLISFPAWQQIGKLITSGFLISRIDNGTESVIITFKENICMNNLGGYKLLTTLAKKVGGPGKLVALIAPLSQQSRFTSLSVTSTPRTQRASYAETYQTAEYP